MIVILTFTTLSQGIEKKVIFRAYEKNQFYSGLQMKNLRLYENRQPRQITSLCLVQGNKIIQRQGDSKLGLDPRRQFILVFSLRDYDANIDRTIDHFFHNIYLPGDTLSLLTPEKTYQLRPRTLKYKTAGQIADSLKALIRKDTIQGSQKYHSLMEEMITAVREVTTRTNLFSLEETLTRYHQVLIALENVRIIQQKRIIEYIFSTELSSRPPMLILFYDREYKPDFPTRTLQQLKVQWQDRQEIAQPLNELFELYRRDANFNIPQLESEVIQRKMTVYSIFFRNKFVQIRNVYMKEYSEDMFVLFDRLSKASGGMLDMSANPLPAFKKMAAQIHNYYCVTFETPENTGKVPYTLKIQCQNAKLAFAHPLRTD
jgi:hypothetical protein